VHIVHIWMDITVLYSLYMCILASLSNCDWHYIIVDWTMLHQWFTYMWCIFVLWRVFYVDVLFLVVVDSSFSVTVCLQRNKKTHILRVSRYILYFRV